MCQTVLIQIRTDILSDVGSDLGSNCLQRISADDKSRRLQARVKKANSILKEIVSFISIGGRLPFEIKAWNTKAYIIMPNFLIKGLIVFENKIFEQ